MVVKVAAPMVRKASASILVSIRVKNTRQGVPMLVTSVVTSDVS